MMDLVVAMAPAVDVATMTKTFELIRPYLEVRVYRVCLIAFQFLIKATLINFFVSFVSFVF